MGNGCSHLVVDTLDLQDQDNPSTQDHQRNGNHSSLAPHQASQLNHVEEERQSEEQSLQEAWNIAESLTDEPGAIGQAQAEHEHTTNGTQQDSEEGGERGGESEAEGDDDMMDRISSSPSIDDGGYTLHSSPPPYNTARLKVWPARSSSLSPTPTITPTRGDFNSSSASPTSTAESSPFVQTPQHLPLRRNWSDKEASPLSKALD